MRCKRDISFTTKSWLFACVLGLYACSDPVLSPDETHPVAADLTPTEAGKADGYTFNHNLIMSDDVFEDANFINQADIQKFLELTPYGHASFLASYAENGVTVAQKLVDSANTHRINPLVLLVKLQVESSLIFKTEAPGQFLLDRAMGCGCHDGDPSCRRGRLGLFEQIDCAGRLFRSYIDELDRRGVTVSGWSVNQGKRTSDEELIVPSNRATAALYTYTPWVLPGTGGNWLYWNVMRRFSRQLLKNRPNHRWIGGPCESADDCGYRGAVCIALTEGDDAEQAGVCSLGCDRLCPDSQQPYTSTTICIAMSNLGYEEETGVCVSRCVETARGSTCLEPLACSDVNRFGDEGSPAHQACNRPSITDDAETAPAESVETTENESERP
ncbi:MAG: hypothetical protein VYA30_15345 [Myxococcota bacterium]|nr:hypothetical protein [Myxococcota bacterium]